MAAPPGDELIFREVLKGILAEFDNHDAATQKEVQAGMEKIFNTPKLELLTNLLGEEVDAGAAHRIFFWPCLQDMRVYAEVFGLDETHPCGKSIKFHLMSVFYMKHSLDIDLLTAFVFFGGASTLPKLFEHSQLHLRAQSVECFKRVLSLPPPADLPAEEGVKCVWYVKGRREREEFLVKQLHKAVTGADFLPAMLHNMEKDRYPGGVQMCLQVLMFCLGWVRFFFRTDRQLRLCAEVYAAIEAFKDEVHEDKVAPFARQILDDFGKLAPSLESTSSLVAMWRQLDVDPPEEDLTVGDGAAEGVVFWRQLGNGAFKGRRFEAALECYARGVAMGEGKVPGKDLALLHSNTAAVALNQKDYSAAEAAAGAAVAADPTLAKAYYRLAEARLELAKHREALAAVLSLRKLAPADGAAAKLEDKIRRAAPEGSLEGVEAEEPEAAAEDLDGLD